MPGSKTIFTYTLTPKPEEVDKVRAQADRVLGWACEGDTRITCHEVTGTALGAVTLSMTIHGRDRWWATQLAQDILNIVLWGLETGATRLDLQSRRQPPHDHRGYAHGRTKRYRERARTKAQTAGAGDGTEFDEAGDSTGAASAGTTTDTTSAPSDT